MKEIKEEVLKEYTLLKCFPKFIEAIEMAISLTRKELASSLSKNQLAWYNKGLNDAKKELIEKIEKIKESQHICANYHPHFLKKIKGKYVCGGYDRWIVDAEKLKESLKKEVEK